MAVESSRQSIDYCLSRSEEEVLLSNIQLIKSRDRPHYWPKPLQSTDPRTAREQISLLEVPTAAISGCI